MATSSGVTDSDPIAIGVSSRPAARAPKKTRPPTAAGAMTPKRISSSVQAIGWSTATTTASSVRATIKNRKVRLPNPGSPPPLAVAG